MKITDSIYLVPSVRGANSYVFLGKEALVLVDTGMNGNASRTVEFVGELRKEPASIAYIVLTHSDARATFLPISIPMGSLHLGSCIF